MTKELDLDFYDAKTRRMIEAVQVAEEQMLKEARRASSPYMTDITRRQVLHGAVIVGGAAAAVPMFSGAAGAGVPPGSSTGCTTSRSTQGAISIPPK